MERGDCVADGSDKLGIVFPVYVEGLPLIVEKFIRNLKIPANTYIFAVSNYGESAGGSLVQLNTILKEKGCRLSAAFGLKMPDNTQILFPPSSEASQKSDFRREAAAAEVIAQTVRSAAPAGADLIQQAQQTLDSSWQRPPFDPGKMAENFSTDAGCNGCGICANICPMGNVAMEEGKPKWENRCEQCLACMQWCPQRAVQFSNHTSAWGRYHHPDILMEELLRSSLK
jgi:ferredoxin